MDVIRPAYDPRFLEFSMRETIREDIRTRLFGHVGPVGEKEVRAAVAENFAPTPASAGYRHDQDMLTAVKPEYRRAVLHLLGEGE